MTRHYDWNQVFSRQTGTQGEFALIVGGKDIGKTFGLRLDNVRRFISKGIRYVEFERTKTNKHYVQGGYFDKLQQEGFFSDYQFKTEAGIGYIAGKGDHPDWDIVCYFVALTDFQNEKQRTYSNIERSTFDEFIIDKKDRHHRYLPNEPLILANLLDTVFREDPDDDPKFKFYGLGNACDLTNPYFQFFGIDRIPSYGFHWYNDKHTLLHYVEPWDSEKRKQNTLVGRMLAGHAESAMIFDNAFSSEGDHEIDKKTSSAKFAFGLSFMQTRFGIWIDYSRGLFYISGKIPKGSRNLYALTKRDGTIDYQVIRRNESILKMLMDIYYARGIRYETASLRETFLQVLGFLGIK